MGVIAALGPAQRCVCALLRYVKLGRYNSAEISPVIANGRSYYFTCRGTGERKALSCLGIAAEWTLPITYLGMYNPIQYLQYIGRYLPTS